MESLPEALGFAHCSPKSVVERARGAPDRNPWLYDWSLRNRLKHLPSSSLLNLSERWNCCAHISQGREESRENFEKRWLSIHSCSGTAPRCRLLMKCLYCGESPWNLKSTKSQSTCLLAPNFLSPSFRTMTWSAILPSNFCNYVLNNEEKRWLRCCHRLEL